MAGLGARIDKLDKSAVMTVEVTSEFRLRARLALLLFKLAGWILGCSVDLKINRHG